jgi:hypothetical protein
MRFAFFDLDDTLVDTGAAPSPYSATIGEAIAIIEASAESE